MYIEVKYNLNRLLFIETKEDKILYELHIYRSMCRRDTVYRMDELPAEAAQSHNEGKAGAKYTRSKRPVKLVYYEGFETKEEAMRREYAIKQLTRKQKLNLMEF